jgi:hypothetical protein
MAYITELKAMDLSRNWEAQAKHRRGFDIRTKVAGLEVSSAEPCLLLKAELDRVISSHWWGEEIRLDGGGWSSESLMASWDDSESEFSMAYRGDDFSQGGNCKEE